MIEGSVCLIEFVFSNMEGEVIEEYFTSVVIEKVEADSYMLCRTPDGNILRLPYDIENMEELEPGDYTDKKSGLVISDPDFFISWEVRVENASDIEVIKEKGYVETAE